MKRFLSNLTLVLLAFSVSASAGLAQQEGSKSKVTIDRKQSDQKEKKQQANKTAEKPECRCVFSDIEMTDICGKKVKLSDYKGKVVLIVNVASKCGFTGQYGPLQSIYEDLNEQGLEVIAFPCNQFGKQEPGDEEQISTFCKKRFGIAFDIFSKVDVKGEKQAELFKRLTAMKLEPAGKGDIKWNFEKFIIGKDGKPIARFRSDVHPNSDALVKKIKEALAVEDGQPNSKSDAKNVKAKSRKAKPASKVDKQSPEKTKTMLEGFPAIATLPVQWGDQDLFGHVNNTVYFRWFETSRVEYWYSSGLQDLMGPRGLGPILASVNCDYKKQVRYPDTIKVAAKIQKMGHSSVTLEHLVVSESQESVVATGKSVIVLFNYEKQHPVPIEGDIRDAFLKFDPFE